MKLSDIVPDVRTLLSLAPEELAGIIIRILNSRPANERLQVHPYNDSGPMVREYGDPSDKCLQAISEAWAAMEHMGLVTRDPTQSTNSLFQIITRRGAAIGSADDFRAFQFAQKFGAATLHKAIADSVYPLFIRGHYDTAVFEAFREIEVAVRAACGSSVSTDDVGVKLMRKAFAVDGGPLTDDEEPAAEREALMHLFAGAIGRFKNPTSHRRVTLTDPAETIEMLHFASHLLRIVDERPRRRGAVA